MKIDRSDHPLKGFVLVLEEVDHLRSVFTEFTMLNSAENLQKYNMVIDCDCDLMDGFVSGGKINRFVVQGRIVYVENGVECALNTLKNLVTSHALYKILP